MPSADDDIVIECSPYGDSETEILNLKTASYEIKSMPNIFDYEKSLSGFIGIVISMSVILVFYIISRIIKGSSNVNMSNITNKFLYLSYFILLIIGTIVNIPQDNPNDLIPLYVIFGIVIIFIIIIRAQRFNTYAGGINAIMPGFIVNKPRRIPYNIGLFLFYLDLFTW